MAADLDRMGNQSGAAMMTSCCGLMSCLLPRLGIIPSVRHVPFQITDALGAGYFAWGLLRYSAENKKIEMNVFAADPTDDLSLDTSRDDNADSRRQQQQYPGLIAAATGASPTQQQQQR